MDVIKYFGGSICHHQELATEVLTEMGLKYSSSEEKRKAVTTARQKYLAAAFLMGSDRQRYGSLIEYLENSFVKGNDEWPNTLNSFYALLMNWKKDQRFTRITSQYGGENGINYHMKGEDSDEQIQTTTGGRGKTGRLGYQGSG